MLKERRNQTKVLKHVGDVQRIDEKIENFF